MNRRYEVTVNDAESPRVDVLTIWAADEAAAIEVAKDMIDYRDKRNVSAAKVSVRIVGDKAQDGDIVLKDG